MISDRQKARNILFMGLSLSPDAERQNLDKCIWKMSPSGRTKNWAGKFRARQRTHEGHKTPVENWLFRASSNHNIQIGGCEKGKKWAGFGKTRQKLMTEIPMKGSKGLTYGKGALT